MPYWLFIVKKLMDQKKKKEFIYCLKTYPVPIEQMVPDGKVGTEDGKCISKKDLHDLYKADEVTEKTLVEGKLVDQVVHLKAKKLPDHKDDSEFETYYQELVDDAATTLEKCCGWVVAGIRHQTKSGATDYQPVLMSYCSDEAGPKKKMLVGSSHGGLSNELGGFKFYQANGLDELSDLKAVRAIC